MQPDERDAAYLWDMWDAARTIRDFMTGVDRGAYLGNRMLQLAVERCVQAIGEAARRVSDEFKAAHPDIPGGGSLRSAMSWPMSKEPSIRNVCGHWSARMFRN